MVSSIPRNIGIAAHELDRAIGRERPLESYGTYRLGKAIDRGAEAVLPAPPPPGEETFLGSTLPRGAGSMAGFVAGGIAGRAAKLPALLTTAALGSTSEGSGLYESAKAQGADDDTALDAWVSGSVLGLTEAIPISRALKKADQATGGGLKKLLASGFKGGAEEALQELIQTAGGEKVEAEVIGEGAPESTLDYFLNQEAGEATGAGAILGTGLSLATAAVGGRRATRGRETSRLAQLEKELEAPAAPDPEFQKGFQELLDPESTSAPPPAESPSLPTRETAGPQLDPKAEPLSAEDILEHPELPDIYGKDYLSRPLDPDQAIEPPPAPADEGFDPGYIESLTETGEHAPGLPQEAATESAPTLTPAESLKAETEAFQTESRAKDDKAKMDLVLGTPLGDIESTQKGPLFGKQKQLTMGDAATTAKSEAKQKRTKRIRSYYDEGTIEGRIAEGGGIKLDLTKEEDQRLLLQNTKAKKGGRSYSRFDPIYNKDATQKVDQWFETFKGEGLIPSNWDQSDFESALTDRSRKTGEGGKYRGSPLSSQEFDPDSVMEISEAEYNKRMATLYSNPLIPMAEFYTQNIGKPLWEAGGALLNRASPDFLKRWLTIRPGQPKGYVKAAKKREQAIGEGRDKGLELGRKLTEGVSQKVQISLGRVLRGEASKQELEVLRKEPKWNEALEAVKVARAELDNLGGAAVTQGLLKEPSFFTNYGQYMPRLYRRYEVDYEDLVATVSQGKKPNRLELDRFKSRKDIPEAVRALMGEIQEPGYPVAKGISDLTQDVETAKLYNFVADNPEWAQSPETIKPGQMADFELMPTTPKLGKLSGQYVLKGIADDLNSQIEVKSEGVKIARGLMSEWKFLKVVVNPSTHGRNLMSNTLLAYLGGLPPTRVDVYGKALIQMAKKEGKEYAAAKKAGLFSSTWAQAEMDLLVDSWNRTGAGGMWGKLSEIKEHLDKGETAAGVKKASPSSTKAGRKAGVIYQAEESWFKLAKFMHAQEKGMSAEKAAENANEWLFDYGEVPKFVDWARRSPLGAPFITFTYKALPAIAKSAVLYPWRLAGVVYALHAIAEGSKDALGIDAEDAEDLDSILPDRIKDGPMGPKSLLLPWKDKYGQLQYIDLTYVLPWGDVGETSGTGWPNVIPIMQGPVKSLWEIMVNKSTFTGGEIYKKTDTQAESMQKMSMHLYRTVAPSLAPGGYGFSRLVSSAQGEEDYFGRTTGVPAAIGSSLAGIKINPIDPEKERFFRQKEMEGYMDDLMMEGYKVMNHQGKDDETKMREIDKLRRKGRERVEEYQGR